MSKGFIPSRVSTLLLYGLNRFGQKKRAPVIGSSQESLLLYYNAATNAAVSPETV